MEELTALIALGVAMNNSGGGDVETGSSDDDDGDSDNEDNDSDVIGSGDDDDNDDMDNNKGGSGSNGEDNEERLNEEFNRLAAEVLDMLNKRDIQGEDIDNLKKLLKNGSVSRADFTVKDGIKELRELKEDIQDFPEQVRDFPEQVPVKKAKPLGMFGRASVYIRGLNPFRRVQKTSADVAILKKQLLNARTRNDQLKKDLKEKLKKCEQEKAALRTTNNDLTTANSALEEKNKRLSAEKNNLIEEARKSGVKEGTLNVMTETMKRQRLQLGENEKKLKALKKKLAVKEDELAAAQQQKLDMNNEQTRVAKVNVDVAAANQVLNDQNTDLQRRVSTLETNLEASKKALAETNGKLEECQGKLAEAQKRATDAETTAGEARSELKECQDELADALNAKAAIEEELSECKEKEEEVSLLLETNAEETNNLEKEKETLTQGLSDCNEKLTRKDEKIKELEARIEELESDDQRESGDTFNDGNLRVGPDMTGVGGNSKLPKSPQRLPTANEAKADRKKSGNLASESAANSRNRGFFMLGSDFDLVPGTNQKSSNMASVNESPNADNSSSAEDKLTPKKRTKRRNDSLRKLNLVFNKLKVKRPKIDDKFIRVQVMNSLQEEFDDLFSGRGKKGIFTYIKEKKNEIEEKLENQNITKQALDEIDQDIENLKWFNDEVDSKLEKVLEEMGEESEQGQTSGMVRRYSTRSSTTGLMSLRF